MTSIAAASHTVTSSPVVLCLGAFSACKPGRGRRLQVRDASGVVFATLDGSSSDSSGNRILSGQLPKTLPAGTKLFDGVVAGLAEIGPARGRIRIRELRDQRGPAELLGAQPFARMGLVELPQPFLGHGLAEPPGHLHRL